MAVPIPKIHSYWISPNQTVPPVSPPGPTLVSSEDGEGQMGHPGGMWPLGLSHEDGQTDGFPTGLPTPPHGKPV